MKKNLAKRITLSILAGAMLMSSSVAWAGFVAVTETADNTLDNGSSSATGSWSVAVGYNNGASGEGSIAIGNNSFAEGKNSIVIGANASGEYSNDGEKNYSKYDNSIVIGARSKSRATNGVVLGNDTYVGGTNSVALGFGSRVENDDSNVVSVGSGESADSSTYQYRKIINVADGESDHDAVNVGQLSAVDNKIGDMGNLANTNYLKESSSLVKAVSTLDSKVKDNRDDIGEVNSDYDYAYGNYIGNNKNLTEAAVALDKQVKANADAIANKANASDVASTYLKITDAENTYVKIQSTESPTPSSGFSVVNTGSITKVTVTEVDATNSVEISSATGITVGSNSAHINSTGFYAGRKNTNLDHTYDNVKAAMTEDGKLKAADGNFEVDENGNVKAKTVTAENLYTKTEIDEKLGGSNASLAGLNQRLDKTNAKINKVGAGAAALAALHPLEYDPDDKLTFSAGMGNYAGENAAALGAFYRPNEKFMVSLGGTMGNGENMVNLGLSIGLDKPNGYAKLSKRELIQEVNAVKAENEAMKDQLANADERIAKLEALVAQLASK